MEVVVTIGVTIRTEFQSNRRRQQNNIHNSYNNITIYYCDDIIYNNNIIMNNKCLVKINRTVSLKHLQHSRMQKRRHLGLNNPLSW